MEGEKERERERGETFQSSYSTESFEALCKWWSRLREEQGKRINIGRE